jgi:hypothetical protein
VPRRFPLLQHRWVYMCGVEGAIGEDTEKRWGRVGGWGLGEWGSGSCFGIDLPEADNRGYSAPAGPLENEMHFAHTPFVVISAIKNSIVSGPFLIEASFTRFLISATSGTVSAQITKFLSARSGERRASQQDKVVESSKRFFYMPDHR